VSDVNSIAAIVKIEDFTQADSRST